MTPKTFVGLTIMTGLLGGFAGACGMAVGGIWGQDLTWRIAATIGAIGGITFTLGFICAQFLPDEYPPHSPTRRARDGRDEA